MPSGRIIPSSANMRTQRNPAPACTTGQLWKLVDLNDILAVFHRKAKAQFEEAQSHQDYADYFKRVWIERTETPVWKRKDWPDDELA